MNAVCFEREAVVCADDIISEDDIISDEDAAPPTERAPASGIARLVASMAPDGPDALDDTPPRPPTVDLLAAAAGLYDAATIAAMREHYVREEMSEALALASRLLIVNDADIAAIDHASLERDPY